MTKTGASATIVEDGSAANLRDGERVKVIAHGDRPMLGPTIGLYGHVEHCEESVIVVKFETGGEFSYPTDCLEKAPLTNEKHG